MQKMQIEISYQDQIDLEKICTDKGWSYSVFFKMLLDGYRDYGFPGDVAKSLGMERNTISQKEAEKMFPIDNESLEKVEEKPKRKGRPPKAK